ncbi:MAG: hypothetical protein EX254_00905 [Flavobacteriaceae bacterium]|nr:hypothetical protein [Bacteroidia bacterium]NNL60372.1 hypothetical protein [Flavobacteriaceae bacterium]RZV69920.1 MAG: hypothetical protein EX254_00905 [Flavobacteriaceae bacterium]
MENKTALIVSGVILMTFFVLGLLDIMYSLEIMENLVTKIVLIGSFIAFVVYIIKANKDGHKKNLPK